MNPSNFRSSKFAVAILAVVLALPALAQKRRSVQHPAPSAPGVAVTVTGKVLDAVTGAPVVFATVRLGNRIDRTDTAGEFEVKGTIYGEADVTAERSGYTSTKQAVSSGGPLAITLRMQPTPTVTLRLVDGTQRIIDLESVEFGYVPPFGSYVKSEHDDFCKPDGTTVRVSRLEMARIVGPAVLETSGGCCPNPLQRVTITLKNGQTSPMYFADSCDGRSIDLISRDHVSGQSVFAKFSNIAEVIFP